MGRLLIIMAICGLLSTTAAQSICGDCNMDGRVDVLDALTAAQHDVGIITLTGLSLIFCDVNTSTTVTVIDSLLLAQWNVGLPIVLVCPPPPDVPVARILEPELGGMLVNELVLASPQGIEVLNTTPFPIDLSGWRLLKAEIDGIPDLYYTFPGAGGSATTVAQPATPIFVREDTGVDTATLLFAGVDIDWGNPILGGYVGLLDAGFLPIDSMVAGTPLFSPPLDFAAPGPIGLGSVYRNSDNDTNSASDWDGVPPATPEALGPGQSGAGTTAGSFRGNVRIIYLLSDMSSDPADIDVDWSSDGGLSWSVATESTGFPSEGQSALATAPGGIRHIFDWDTFADLGGALSSATVVRIIPRDVMGIGVLDVSAPFEVDDRNDAPSLTVQTPGPPPIVRVNELFLGATDGIEICSFGAQPLNLAGFTVHKTELDGVDDTWFTFPAGAIAMPGQPIHLSDDSGVSTATRIRVGTDIFWSTFFGGRAWVADSSGAILDFVEFGTVLGTAPATFTGPLTATTNFVARINDADTDGAADWASRATGSGELLNPGQIGAAPQTPLATPVPVGYVLVDAQSDACSLAVAFSSDGGLTWNPAAQGAGGDGTTALVASPAGVGHRYAWDAASDLGMGSFTGLLLELTPSDAYAIGAPVQTGAFDLDLGDGCPGLPIAVPSVTVADTSAFSDDLSATCGGGGGRDHVYRFTATSEGLITASLCGAPFDTVLSVRQGDCAGVEIACNDDGCGIASTLMFTPVCGESYTLIVDGKSALAAGAYTLTLTQAPAARENCPGLDISATGMASGDTTCGGIVGFSLTCPASLLSTEHVYRYTAASTGTLQASLCGAGTTYNSILHAREGSCFGAELACDDDACFPFGASELSFPCQAGVTYVIFVDGFTGAAGNYVLVITEM